MARKRCNTCDGEYDELTPGGMRYFHTCPPVAEYFDAPGAPISRDTAESIMQLGGSYRIRYVARVNARNENAINLRDPALKGQPKQAGLGAVEIAPAAADPLADTELITVAAPKVR